MHERLKNFFAAKPECVIEWHDDYTPAVGWLVMNSLRNGAAGGGTRMHEACSFSEVDQLAKTMEIKFTVSGPAIGGAKSGIRYAFKSEKDKQDVLRRWFLYIQKELKTHYGTGGDQNVDFKSDVTPLLLELGIRHPQEGIVHGLYPHLSVSERDAIIDNLRQGILAPVMSDSFLHNLDFRIADSATGYGVVSAISAYYDLRGESLQGKKIIIEGFGNVGSAAAYYAWRKGAYIVGVIDKDWYMFDDAGIDIGDLLKARVSGRIHTDVPSLKSYTGSLDFYPHADVFVPAATSHTVHRDRLKCLKDSGIAIIASGANNPFIDSETEEVADNQVSVIPEFIVNCGMARCFAYFMQPNVTTGEKAILHDIDVCIEKAVTNLFSQNNSLSHLTSTAFDIALDAIESPSL